MVEKCVHFDEENIHFFQKTHDLAHFSNFQPKGNPLKKVKNFLIPNIKMYTFFHHKNEKKFLESKMKPQHIFKIYPIHMGHPS